MAARPLNEAVQQAEEAISGGNYQLAVETCRRVLGQFPEFATAHRLLAEAHLEEGDVAAAERAFHETLQRDPQSSAAYAGLATIAEGRGDAESALAYAQVAWEIMPQRADLRDRVAGLSEGLYGKGGRLHLTRAALTSIHFRAGRWSRAASEAASVLAEYPSRTDVRLRMAEALWRRGNLTAAADACRAVLESAPSAVMALLMLADVERRQGSQDSAEQLLNRARAIDPDGVRAADLVTIGANDLAEFILPGKMAEFDDAVEVVAEVERPRIAPAPDFNWTQPAVQEQPAPATDADSLVSESSLGPDANAAGVAGGEEDFDVSLPDDAEIEAARPPSGGQRGYTSMLESLEGEGLMPFRLEGEEGQEVSDELAASAEQASDDDVFSLVSDEEIDAARPPDERPHGYTSMLNSLDETGVAPFEVEGEPGYPTEPEQPVDQLQASESTEAVADAEMPTGTVESVDYGADLTAGWDNIDDEIERATPTGEAKLSGYTGQLRDLDEIGVQPFAFEGVEPPEPYQSESQFDADDIGEVDDSFADDLSFLDAAPESETQTEAQADTMPLDVDLTDGWATIDEEIQNAIPVETPPGYTDELSLLTESGVEPFVVDEGEPIVEAQIEAEPPTSVEEEDVVADDLAAGIDLWTFESEPEEDVADAVSPPVESESVSEADLFDFADAEAVEEVPMEEVAAASPPAWETDAVVDEVPVTVDQQEIAPTEMEVVEAVADEAAPVILDTATAEVASADNVRVSIAHLGLDAALFERARASKAELVASGQIQGDLLLPGVEPPGPTLEMLEEMVQENPDDQDVRRQLAGSLLEAEQFERALAQYQWMFRQRHELTEDDLANLSRLTEADGEHQVRSHRLLAAIYRRSGDLGMSARQYHLSLLGGRVHAEKEG